jgi:hypothetical protein
MFIMNYLATSMIVKCFIQSGHSCVNHMRIFLAIIIDICGSVIDSNYHKSYIEQTFTKGTHIFMIIV